MQLIGGKSGFKNLRDLLLCLVGLFICLFHLVRTPPQDLSVPVLLFGGGMAGSPYVIRRDEKKG